MANITNKTQTKKSQKLGKVKWYDTTKGFGFIESEDGNDIFVHYTGIPFVNGKKVSLVSDQRVSFEVTEGKRGPQATNVAVTAV